MISKHKISIGFVALPNVIFNVPFKTCGRTFNFVFNNLEVFRPGWIN